MDTKDAICNAALELFSAGGLNAIVMRDVAKALGVSAMMPYRYFPSKDHLLMELRTRSFRQFTQSLIRAKSKAKTQAETLPYMCRGYLLFAYYKPNAYRLMFDLWAFENPAVIKAEFGESAKRQPGSWLEVKGAVEDRMLSQGSRLDLNETAHVVWSTLHGVASLYLANKLVFGCSYRQICRPLISAILEGVDG
ncbi:TetR/AcrR family transcriptional regulator [Aestuariicella hydrocarbonica]|uniref:TetR/AcrR family transcriptional regulator n=1 Tax=Pseudomaricurvus hydrocarbonicus TaxID=1470433 RepID=A0A9E5JSW7_9GAMM|nr:TetR/AcrR family transcriptional regulator [Aestuariicella hydrocarbonica]NHO64270.1 TetR/AcrR family transcriptional regulator [Aestuariicella hydrocarbonica]